MNLPTNRNTLTDVETRLVAARGKVRRAVGRGSLERVWVTAAAARLQKCFRSRISTAWPRWMWGLRGSWGHPITASDAGKTPATFFFFFPHMEVPRLGVKSEPCHCCGSGYSCGAVLFFLFFLFFFFFVFLPFWGHSSGIWRFPG